MRKLFFLLLIFTASCFEGTKILPESTGSFSEIVFVIDDYIWDEGIGKVVFEVFQAPIPGLNQNEFSFRAIQVNHAEFKSILKTHQNIVVLGDGVKVGSQKNKWANGQLVVQLNCEKETIRRELKKVKSIFEVEEIRKTKSEISETSQKSPQRNIYRNFQVDLLIPSEYTIIKDTSTFFWATYNPQRKEVIKNLLVFSFIPESNNLQEELFQKTNNVFMENLKGAKAGQYVKVETDFPLHQINNTYRGLWRLHNGFMGGPFLLKTYFIDDKIVVSVGLVFDPNSKKRMYLRTFEAIL